MDKFKIKEEFKMLKNKIYNDKVFREIKNSKLITFKYLLPFRIPINEIENINFINENNTFITLNHRKHNVMEKDNIKRNRQSYIELTSIIKHKKFKKIKLNSSSRESKQSEVLTDIFNQQRACLNNLIKIISIKYQYHNVYELSLGDILSIPYYVIYTKNGEIINMSLFKINISGKIEEDQYSNLTKKELLNIKKNYNILVNHPSNTYVMPMRKGERAIYNSNYNVAIVQIQTALEVFISRFVERYYKLDTKLDDKKIQGNISCGYRNVVNQHFIKIIQTLNLRYSEEIKNCVALYLKDYYDIRNEIVHAGATFKKHDALEFQEIVRDMIVLVTHGMKYVKSSSFSNEFNIYNFINKTIDIIAIKDKYSKKTN